MMTKASRTAGVLVALAVAGSTVAAAQQGEEARDGAEIAAKLCSNCHATDPGGQQVARADVPPFKAIANDPRTTPERLAAAIILPHPEMPGIALTRAEIRAIISYVMSLRTP